MICAVSNIGNYQLLPIIAGNTISGCIYHWELYSLSRSRQIAGWSRAVAEDVLVSYSTWWFPEMEVPVNLHFKPSILGTTMLGNLQLHIHLPINQAVQSSFTLCTKSKSQCRKNPSLMTQQDASVSIMKPACRKHRPELWSDLWIPQNAYLM